MGRASSAADAHSLNRLSHPALSRPTPALSPLAVSRLPAASTQAHMFSWGWDFLPPIGNSHLHLHQ